MYFSFYFPHVFQVLKDEVIQAKCEIYLSKYFLIFPNELYQMEPV